LGLLIEADTLSALNAAEVVRTKLDAIIGLKKRVEAKQLENAVRDYIAQKPWLIAPKWETFKTETKVQHVLDEASKEVKLDTDEYKGRVDLALSSGCQLLIVEFMRPSLIINWDHLQRCNRYVTLIQSKISAQTGLGFTKVEGLIVADDIDKSADIGIEVKRLEQSGIVTLEWKTLLSQAESNWKEFLDILSKRAPEDTRLQELKTGINVSLSVVGPTKK
jgi:hypothetical protein